MWPDVLYYLPPSPATTSCRGRGPNLTAAPAWLLQTVFTPWLWWWGGLWPRPGPGRNRKQERALHTHNVFTAPPSLPLPPNYNYPSACYSSTDSSPQLLLIIKVN